MRRTLRVIAALLAILCLAVWIALGANRGWTKTTSTRMAKDPVTEIDYPVIEKHFSPGIEVLGIGLLASAALVGLSFTIKKCKTAMTRLIIQIGSTLALAASISAAPIDFDFKDPKGVNNIVFKTDAVVESINGTASGISGNVTFDPENPAATKGKIVVAANTLHVGNPMMKTHLHSDMWLDVAKHPEITFDLGTLKNVKTDANVTTADALGKLTIKGTTKEITAPVKLTYLKDKLKQRTGKDGDLLVVRSNFVIKRTDFGINPGSGEEKVSNDIELNLSLAGAALRR